MFAARRDRRADSTTPLQLDADAFAAVFGRDGLRLRHRFAHHADFSMEALAELAAALPRKDVECHAAEQPLVVPGGAADVDGAPAELVRGVTSDRRWLVLWYIEQVAKYRKILHDCVDQVAGVVGVLEGGVSPRRKEAFLFLSAPGALTPVHFDPEQNLLLQIDGVKEVNIVHFADAAAETEELRRYYQGGHRNLDRPPTGRHTVYTLRPGDGLYIPPFAPHWVQNGAERSTSLSITFRSSKSERSELCWEVNARLQRMGMRPRLPGQSILVDRAKAFTLRMAREVKNLLHREITR
jgi:hypothetical protein